MLWLIGLLTTLLVLAADLAAPQPVEAAGLHLCLAMACLLLAPAFAVLQSLLTARRWAGVAILEHRAEFLHRSLLGSNLIIWLFGCVALLALAKWPQLVRQNWQLADWPLLDELALALPMVASLLLSWLVIFDAEKVLQPSADHGKLWPRSQLAVQRLRTFGGLVLIPLVLLFLGRDLLDLWYPAGISPQWAGLASIGFVVALLGCYPLLLSWTWKTRSLEDAALHQRLQEVAVEAGLPNERIRVWETNDTVTNAIVVGVIPGLRRVFLSDQLLQRFSAEEVAGIYRHEMGHLIHQHLSMRLALVLVPLLSIVTCFYLASPEVLVADYHATALRVCVWIFTGLAFLGYLSQVVSRFICRSEMQADMYAIRGRDGRICQRRATAYCQALQKMAAQSPDVHERSTLTHPSIKLRMEVIRQVLERPERLARFESRFRREQQLTALCLTGLVVLAVTVGKII